MFKINNKDTRTTSSTYFTPFCSISFFNFEQRNFCWVMRLLKNNSRSNVRSENTQFLPILVISYFCPAGKYMFKVNNRNTRAGCEICSKLTIKTPGRRHWRRSGVFIVNFEHISHLVLVFLLLTLSR